ncbi:MAG: restriction endonuclease subunit S [Paludibacteraceae bacterium]|nr:restriction endonuclease subunit S [Paludibacteraceae bacterium]
MANYPTYKLGEIIDKVPIEFKVKQKEYLPKGKFPVVDQGQDLIGGFVDDESLLVKTELPVIVFGDHTKAKKFIDFPFVAGADGTKIIKPKKEFFIEPRLFYWFLHCVKFPDKGYARHFQYLLKSDIAVPPLPTQRTIVARIEELFAELDKAVDKLKTARQQLKTYRQAVLNHWLNNDEGKWEMVKLKDCTKKIFAGGDVPKNNFSEIKTEKYRIPIYANAVKQKGLYGYTDVSRVNEPCVTIAGRGSGTGHTEIREEPFFPIVRLIVIIPSDNLNNSFLKYMVDSKTMAITGSAIPQLTVPTVEEYEFSLPPLSEQQRIVQEIESRLSQATASETYIENALQQAEALRQSILKKAFSGELV